jgi:hypothetical protein
LSSQLACQQQVKSLKGLLNDPRWFLTVLVGADSIIKKSCFVKVEHHTSGEKSLPLWFKLCRGVR